MLFGQQRQELPRADDAGATIPLDHQEDRPTTWDDAEEVTSEHALIEYVDVSTDGKWLALSSD